MSLKTDVYSLLANDTTLAGLGILPGSILAANATDIPPPRPFVILAYGPETVAWAHARTVSLAIWAHDDPGTYQRIDSILDRVREIIAGAEDQLRSPNWIGDSQDLYDDGYKTLSRYSTYILAPGYQSTLVGK